MSVNRLHWSADCLPIGYIGSLSVIGYCSVVCTV